VAEIAAEEQGVAVGLGARDVLGGDVRPRAGAVVHDDGLAELAPQRLGEHPGEEVAGAAGRESDDEADRARGGPGGGLRPGGPRGRRGQGERPRGGGGAAAGQHHRVWIVSNSSVSSVCRVHRPAVKRTRNPTARYSRTSATTATIAGARSHFIRRYAINHRASRPRVSRVVEGASQAVDVCAVLEVQADRVADGVLRRPRQLLGAGVRQGKVPALVAMGRGYRRIGRELGLSKNTVVGVVNRSTPADS
jgi:hypothetical protein